MAAACAGGAVVGATVPVQWTPSSVAVGGASRSVAFRGAAVVFPKPLMVSRAQKSVVKVSAEGGESPVALKVNTL